MRMLFVQATALATLLATSGFGFATSPCPAALSYGGGPSGLQSSLPYLLDESACPTHALSNAGETRLGDLTPAHRDSPLAGCDRAALCRPPIWGTGSRQRFLGCLPPQEAFSQIRVPNGACSPIGFRGRSAVIRRNV